MEVIMTKYLHPGVYVEEIHDKTRTIERAPGSIPAFIGATFRGPVGEAVRVRSWDDFVARFGDTGQPGGIHDENDHTAMSVSAFYRNGGGETYICRVATDGYSGVYQGALSKLDDVSILLLPGQQWSANGSGNDVIRQAIAHCESTGRQMVIVDPPANTELVDGRTVANLALPASSYAALYYPWVAIDNPLFDASLNPGAPRQLHIPPSSLAAAVWARTDAQRGVWKAPAGREAGVVVSGLQYAVTSGEQRALNPLGVNCIRSFPRLGSLLWGARTLASQADPEWRYVNVRRTAIMIEQSIYRSIQWVVFEPNGTALWSALKSSLKAFMRGLFHDGALQGSSEQQAYFVRCGLGETMSQSDVNLGQVIIELGFAPVKPAEFVILKIQHKTG
jgi:phage tail sheath protein FI